MMPRIGEVIKEYRIKAGLSQQVLGEKVGLSASHRQRVSDWEAGRKTPDAKYIFRMVAVLKIPLEEFDEYREALE